MGRGSRKWPQVLKCASASMKSGISPVTSRYPATKMVFFQLEGGNHPEKIKSFKFQVIFVHVCVCEGERNKQRQ